MPELCRLLLHEEEDTETYKKVLKANAVFLGDIKKIGKIMNKFSEYSLSVFENESAEEFPDEENIEEMDIVQIPDQAQKPDILTFDLDDIPEDNYEYIQKQKESLIDKFINGEHGVIRADKAVSLSGDVSRESIIEHDSLITDTLAKIYIKQGLYTKAIYAYEKLILKYPTKSAYFASQIEEIKKLINK